MIIGQLCEDPAKFKHDATLTNPQRRMLTSERLGSSTTLNPSAPRRSVRSP